MEAPLMARRSFPGDPLTPRQAEILRWIAGFIASNAYPPTLREMCAALDLTSTNAASDHLRALARKGYIAREKLKSRGMRILRMPE